MEWNIWHSINQFIEQQPKKKILKNKQPNKKSQEEEK